MNHFRVVISHFVSLVRLTFRSYHAVAGLDIAGLVLASRRTLRSTSSNRTGHVKPQAVCVNWVWQATEWVDDSTGPFVAIILRSAQIRH
jgi:hypothetical protein